MKITKEKLVEIIKEEIAGLDEGIFDAFRAAAKPSTRGGYRAAGERGAESEEAFADRAAEIDASDSTAGLNKGQMKAYNAAVTDATADAAKMDAKASKEDFTRVMRWANDNKIATERDIAKSILKAIETMDSGMIAKIQEPLLSDDDFIKELIDKINQFKHKSGE